MNPDPQSAQSLIHQAVQALREGDRGAARRLAQQASALAPESEEPWLLLAYVSPSRAAQYYVSRALQVNPSSSRAQAAQAWLKSQSEQAAKSAPAAESPSASPSVPPAEAPTVYPILQTAEKAAAGLTPPADLRQPSPTRRKTSFAFTWLIVLVLVAGLAILGAYRLAAGQGFPLFGIDPPTPVPSPTITSSPQPSSTATTAPTSTQTAAPTSTSTPTPLPTETATPLPTETSTPLPTETSTPTAPPTATQAPSPTPAQSTPVAVSKYKVQPGDTLSKIAQRFDVSVQALIDANTLINPSIIFAGQMLNIPKPGTYTLASQPTEAPAPAGSSGKNKEILIDISEQHMWAYEDKQLVFSFVVSTGTGNSTRIGTFKVLDKIPNAYSTRFNIWMPYWLGIYYSGTLENGIHGLPLLWNGVELWGNLLGQPATYGCIEARTFEIKQLYNWAEIGTPVIIRR